MSWGHLPLPIGQPSDHVQAPALLTERNGKSLNAGHFPALQEDEFFFCNQGKQITSICPAGHLAWLAEAASFPASMSLPLLPSPRQPAKGIILTNNLLTWAGPALGPASPPLTLALPLLSLPKHLLPATGLYSMVSSPRPPPGCSYLYQQPAVSLPESA